jgi:hypothetical protein
LQPLADLYLPLSKAAQLSQHTEVAMKTSIATLTFLTILFSTSAFADRCTRSLSRMQGYTIISVTQVDGEFQGCDFSRVIKFMDGTALRCSSYSYTYSYMPDAVIFGKTITYQGRSFVTLKVLIEGEIFEMESVVVRK